MSSELCECFSLIHVSLDAFASFTRFTFMNPALNARRELLNNTAVCCVEKWRNQRGLSDVHEEDVSVSECPCWAFKHCHGVFACSKKWLCVSLTVPEARRVCLDFDVWTPRQIQDIYSGMPRGHTVGGDVVAVRAASLPSSPSLLTYDFAPLSSCLFFLKRGGAV